MTDAKRAALRNGVKQREPLPPLPVAQYLGELDQLIAAHNPFAHDRVVLAIGRGAAPREVVQRFALELYWLGRWTTPDLALLIANAPDGYAFTMAHSRHYRHWADGLAAVAGYLGDPSRIGTQVELCRQLDLGEEDIRRYRPLPETVAMTFTMLYYVRRSYEEGLAVFGYAGERVAAGSGYARKLYDGLRAHYGVTVDPVAVHAHPEPDPGEDAAALFPAVATTRSVQERCREAIRNSLLVAETRVRALNAWIA